MSKRIRIERICGLFLLALVSLGAIAESYLTTGHYCLSDQNGYRRCSKVMKDPVDPTLDNALYAQEIPVAGSH
ncbi:hypothetical protein [Aestuariispira insulae]|uniref:Uncharacterized protein n=1 Tax=Aestuariispira insulae TaxID=1461337 RepID=A0A3D9HML8_9PROT|nr:hypothetical protein [Aestuariispira insulae]RED50734.1 hypothetical protein DFP90_1045 [Aestuariispira insulae]